MPLWPKPIQRAQIPDDVRKIFETDGQPRVAQHMAAGGYGPSERPDVMAWLKEQEEIRERPNLIRYYVLTWIAGLTLVSTIIGIIVTLTK